MTIATNCFNPHPAFRPGDAWHRHGVRQGAAVSIRTRPFGRVMQGAGVGEFVFAPSFNPHPAFRPGDAQAAPVGGPDALVSIRTRPFGRVMPALAAAQVVHADVSIRTRPFGRVMRSTWGCRHPVSMFQSAPGLSAG